MRILIGISNNRSDLNILFVRSLFCLEKFTSKEHECEIKFFDYYDVSMMRNFIVKEALKENYDYIFFIDADMVYPEDSIIKLLASGKDIIGGYYIGRKEPMNPVHFKQILNVPEMAKIENCITPSNEIVEQAAGGFGGVLVKRSVLEKMSFPWFRCTYNDEDSSWLGEDIYFFQKASELGLKSYVDTNVKYGHIINAAINPNKSLTL